MEDNRGKARNWFRSPDGFEGSLGRVGNVCNPCPVPQRLPTTDLTHSLRDRVSEYGTEYKLKPIVLGNALINARNPLFLYTTKFNGWCPARPVIRQEPRRSEENKPIRIDTTRYKRLLGQVRHFQEMDMGIRNSTCGAASKIIRCKRPPCLCGTGKEAYSRFEGLATTAWNRLARGGIVRNPLNVTKAYIHVEGYNPNRFKPLEVVPPNNLEEPEALQKAFDLSNAKYVKESKPKKKNSDETEEEINDLDEEDEDSPQ